MDIMSFLKRIYYSYIGHVYWLAYQTEQRRILGVRLSTLIRWAAFLLPLVALWQGWGSVALVVSLVVFLLVQWTYWRARRAGYFRFVAASDQAVPEGELEVLPPYERVPLRATGTFSVKEYDKNVLLQRAEYWQVPLGEHAVMVEHAPGRYVYQFFSAATLRQIQQGWLLHGPRSQAALAISFLSNWEAQGDTDQIRFFGDAPPAGALQTIYFSFDSTQDERAVWHNIVHDARRVRS